MSFRNLIKNETVTRETPCGFSKSRHKKMFKKKVVKRITVEDIDNIGYGFGRLIKTFKDGFARGIDDDDDDTKCETCGKLIDCDCMQCHECDPGLTCDTCGFCHTDGWEAMDCRSSENDPDYDPFDI